MSAKLRVAVVGCGLIGARRAGEAARNPRTQLVAVQDADAARAQMLAQQLACKAVADSRELLEDPSIDVLVVSTPPGFSVEIATAALQRAKHVLIEKPPGRNLEDARRLLDAAKASGRVLKIGFNHRYHPAIRKAHALLQEGAIGKPIHLRAVYGHGGRPGYEKEWRGDPRAAGGGELTDQGVHIADLIHWFLGMPTQAFGILQTAVWPIAPLEDNGFALFRFENGAVASFHTSWTQWKNRFSFEVFGEKGSLSVEGLGGSYGVERLVVALRKPEGGAPQMQEQTFDGPDESWRLEWEDFLRAVDAQAPCWGSPADGVAVMRMISALYRSARESAPVALEGI